MGGTITIIGTGWNRGELTLRAVDLMTGGGKILLHTDHCGCAEWLLERGIAFASLDALYERCEDFDALARAAADAVKEAARSGDVLYCVPDVRDLSARLLMASGAQPRPRVVAGPPVEGALLALCRGETRMVEASDWQEYHLTPRENCLIRELASRELAAEVKLGLLAVYPEETEIWMMNGEAEPEAMLLYALDRGEKYDHRTCALIPAQRSVLALERWDFEHLNEIMRILCGPGGCPWDRVQTHQSLRTCMLEEAYEVIDAIDEGDMDHLCEQLGEVLLQVAIHAEIARLHGEFDITDVTTAICDKMIRRHTHVFGGDDAQSADQVLDLWSRNKMAERSQTTRTESMRDITRALPAMLKAVKVMKRSGEAGLRDESARQAAERCARRLNDVTLDQDAEGALGEALLDLAEMAFLMKVDPEIALNGAIKRFIARFDEIERTITAEGRGFEAMDAETLRKYWDLVKL